MPNAVQADWELIREYHRNGMSYTEIAAKTGVQSGTIASRASRGAWKAIATKAREAVQRSIGTVEISTQPEESSEASKASTAARNGLSRELSRCVDALAGTTPSKRVESLSKRAAVVQTLAGAAKVIHGWSDSSSSPAVRISIMDSAVVLNEQPLPKAIDIESTTLPLESKSSESEHKAQ